MEPLVEALASSSACVSEVTEHGSKTSSSSGFESLAPGTAVGLASIFRDLRRVQRGRII